MPETLKLTERAGRRSRDLGMDASAVPLLIGFLLLLAVAGFMAWLVSSSRKQGQVVFSVAEIQRTTSRVYRSVLAAESGQRGFLLTAERSYLAPYQIGKDAYPDAIAGLLRATKDDPDQQRDAQKIAAAAVQKLDELAKTIELQSAGKNDEALALVKTDLGRNLMVEIREAVDRIQARANREIESEYEEGLNLSRLLLIATLGALLMILVLGALVIRLNRRAIRDSEAGRANVAAQNEMLEAAVQERTSELTESNEEIQRFAYIVSHDLRAPLVNVMGFTSELEALKTELLSAGALPAGDPKRAEAVKEFEESIRFIKAAIDKMEGLIAAILRLSREGRRTFRFEKIATANLIEDLAAAQRHQTDAAGATVEVEKALPTLVADRVALEQIFGNLIDNAIKYLDTSRPGRIEVSGETIGERARISVRDNGRGIAENDHRRVFELFRRSGQQDKRGEGIGLAHVQTLVRSLGGRITLASELGKGSTFTVILPLAPKTSNAAQPDRKGTS